MIKTKNTFVDINGIVLNKVTYYLVTFTINKEFSLFGRIIKEYTQVKEVPFVFKSYEIAKDFCELNPKIKNEVFSVVSNRGYFTTKYYTYKLTMNSKVNAYVVWDHALVDCDSDRAKYMPEKVYPFAEYFIGKENDMTLPKYSEIYQRSPMAPYPKVKNEVEKLSDIFCISRDDKHHFELVEK